MSKKEILCDVLRSFFVLVTNIQYLKAKEDVSFCPLDIKTYSQKKNGLRRFKFYLQIWFEHSKVNFIADYVLEVEGLYHP